MARDMDELRWRASVVAEVIQIRDRADTLLTLLIPEIGQDGACPHPPEYMEDRSSMGDPEYYCRLCQVTQSTPFHSSGGS